MQLNLAQFLLALTANFTQGLTAEKGIVTLESGDTFDVKANAKALQTLLMSASLDLKDAHEQMVQFVSNQPEDTPYYHETREQLVAYRRGLEVLGLGLDVAPVALAAGDPAMQVSTDGGMTYQPALNGVRIIYSKVAIPGEDSPGELHVNASSEGIILDAWTTRDEPLDHNIGTSSESTGDILERLVKDNE